MRTTTRDIERQIGALQREIDQEAAKLDRADAREPLPLSLDLAVRRLKLCPLFSRLNALKARLPDEPRVKPQTMEALLCLLDHVKAEEELRTGFGVVDTGGFAVPHVRSGGQVTFPAARSRPTRWWEATVKVIKTGEIQERYYAAPNRSQVSGIIRRQLSGLELVDVTEITEAEYHAGSAARGHHGGRPRQVG